MVSPVSRGPTGLLIFISSLSEAEGHHSLCAFQGKEQGDLFVAADMWLVTELFCLLQVKLRSKGPQEVSLPSGRGWGSCRAILDLM